jgi:protein-S-isoprenylcysteine O-methyltransferase Ste14
MIQDAPYRIIVIVGFVAVVLVTLYHRIKSWASKEKLDRWQEGALMLFTSRIAGLVLWLAIIAYMIDPAWMTWSTMRLAPWLRWLGAGVLVAAIALLTFTLRSLGTNLTDTVVTRRDSTLVTNGPYAWVRHPFYGSVALVILACALLAANWFLLVMGGVFLALITLRTKIEEDRLLTRFGDAYRLYMARTGRFVPRWPSD